MRPRTDIHLDDDVDAFRPRAPPDTTQLRRGTASASLLPSDRGPGIVNPAVGIGAGSSSRSLSLDDSDRQLRRMRRSRGHTDPIDPNSDEDDDDDDVPNPDAPVNNFHYQDGHDGSDEAGYRHTVRLSRAANRLGFDHESEIAALEEEERHADVHHRQMDKTRVLTHTRNHHHLHKPIPIDGHARAQEIIHSRVDARPVLGFEKRERLRKHLVSKGIIDADPDALLHYDDAVINAAHAADPPEAPPLHGEPGHREYLKEMIRERAMFFPVEQPADSTTVINPSHWAHFVCDVCVALAMEFNYGLHSASLSIHPHRIIEAAENNVTELYSLAGSVMSDVNVPPTLTRRFDIESDDVHAKARAEGPRRGPATVVHRTIVQLFDHYLLDHYDKDVFFKALHHLATEQRPATMPYPFTKKVFCAMHKRVCPEADSPSNWGNLDRKIRSYIHEEELRVSAQLPHIQDVWEERALTEEAKRDAVAAREEEENRRWASLPPEFRDKERPYGIPGVEKRPQQPPRTFHVPRRYHNSDSSQTVVDDHADALEMERDAKLRRGVEEEMRAQQEDRPRKRDISNSH